MSLVDLAYTPKERKEEATEIAEPQPYSWGLNFRLEDEELTKLGVTELPGVGDEWHMTIVASVTQVSQQQMANGDDERCVCLQIQMASIDLNESAAEERKEGKQTPAKEAAETKPTVRKMVEAHHKIATLLTKRSIAGEGATAAPGSGNN